MIRRHPRPPLFPYTPLFRSEQVVTPATPGVYPEVAGENQGRALAQPDIGGTRLDDNDTLAFTAEVDVAPKVELPDLSSLAVTVDDVEVTDEEIDQIGRASCRERV